jgi:hypothetical protein
VTSGLKCRPGDLALIAGAQHPENNGVIVEVLRKSDGKPFWVRGAGACWDVRCAGSKPLLNYHWSDGRKQTLVEGPVPDLALHPLRGTPKKRKRAGRCASLEASA